MPAYISVTKPGAKFNQSCFVHSLPESFIFDNENVRVHTFKYHISCTDGKISVRIMYFYYLFFHRRKPYRNENATSEWDDDGKK